MKPAVMALVFAGIARDASAQVPDTATLGTMVISATKTPSSKASLTQPVTVITGNELRARGITRVSDALRFVPGATLIQNGSAGSVNTLFLRGGESRYTKVLIDGVAVNAPGGFFDFSHLTTDNIERIEVVRGPASVVYGADAVSGIIQIFTREGRGRLNGSIEGRSGNYGSREVSADANGGSARSRYSVGGAMRRTDGMLSFNNQYYNGTLSGSAGVTPRAGTDAHLSARYTAAEFHYPVDFTGLPVDSNSYRVQHRLTVGLDTKTQFSGKVTGRLMLGSNAVSDLTEDIFIPFMFNDIDDRVHSALLSRNKRRNAEASLTFRLPEASVNVGAEHVAESEKSENGEGPVGGPTAPTSRFDADRSNTAVYSEIVASSTAGSSWTLAARRDDNSDYDAFTTYRAGATVPLGTSSRLRASISTAFNAPAFNQLRPTLYTVGSPDLKPERSRSWEVGVEESLVSGIVQFSAGYFDQQFMDLIQYVPGGPPGFLGSYANLTEAQSTGYEAELTLAPVSEWSATAGYTMIRPRVTKVSADYAGDLEPGDALIRRPEHSGNGSITWSRAQSASLSVMASYVGSRPDLDFTNFPAPVVTLPSYVKLDLAGSRSLMRSGSGKSALAITVRVDNALDRRYEDVLGFAAPRRTFLLGARFSGAM